MLAKLLHTVEDTVDEPLQLLGDEVVQGKHDLLHIPSMSLELAPLITQLLNPVSVTVFPSREMHPVIPGH